MYIFHSFIKKIKIKNNSRAILVDDLVKNLKQYSKNAPKNLAQDESNLSEPYMNLEKQVQKYEAEIRNHVRIEQQLRLYAENLENQNQEFEKIQKTGSEKLEQQKEENGILKSKIKQSEFT